MKNLINKALALGFGALLIMSSCKKDEVKAVMPSNAQGGTLQASATTLMLEKANESENAVTFSFGEANFGYKAAVSNTLQLAVAGSSFSAPKEIDLGATLTDKSYTVLDFNALLLTLNLPFDSSTDLEVRVKSSVASNVAPAYSNTVKLTVKPYPLISWVYVPGDYQGWNPASADSLISATGNGIYKGIIYYPNTAGASFEFKITPAKNWNTAYGDGGNGSVSTSGGNFKVPGAGSYEITLDLNANTYEIAKNSWGVIGSATPTGWDSDTDMKYNNGTGTWSVDIALTGGQEFKFRYNDGWGTNLGGTPNALELNGGNIAVATSGTYRIVLDANALTYTLTKL